MFPCTTVPPAILPIPPLIGHTFGSIYCSLQFQSVSFRCAKHYVLVTLNRIIRLIFGPTQLCACKMAACFGPFFGPPAGKRMKLENFAHLLNFVEASWDVMANAQKPDFVFRRNARPHLNRQGASFQSTTGSRGVRISGSNVGYTMLRGSVWRLLATHCIRQFPLHFPSRASPCAITFQLESTTTRKALTSSRGQSTQTNKQTDKQTTRVPLWTEILTTQLLIGKQKDLFTFGIVVYWNFDFRVLIVENK